MCHVNDCSRHYRQDTDIPRSTYCQQTKHILGFNDSFGALRKSMKSGSNVFKSGRTKVFMEKELPQTVDVGYDCIIL